MIKSRLESTVKKLNFLYLESAPKRMKNPTFTIEPRIAKSGTYIYEYDISVKCGLNCDPFLGEQIRELNALNEELQNLFLSLNIDSDGKISTDSTIVNMFDPVILSLEVDSMDTTLCHLLFNVFHD